MSVRWEYALLRFTDDPGAVDAMKAWLFLPDMKEWKDVGAIDAVSTFMGHLNELGRDGWELIGPPSDLNAVFTYKADNDTYHDRAYSVQRDFWLKREASA